MRPRATSNALADLTGILASDRSRIEALELVAHRHRYALDPTVWTAVTFSGSWVNVAGQQTVQYRKIGDVVSVRGVATGGGAATAVFTLPVGFRPPAALRFATTANAAFGDFTISTGGVVTHATGSTTNLWLNCTFSITT